MNRTHSVVSKNNDDGGSARISDGSEVRGGVEGQGRTMEEGRKEGRDEWKDGGSRARRIIWRSEGRAQETTKQSRTERTEVQK